MSETAPKSESTRLAHNRTDLAEDRTLLANERTFAGWGRTALASIGIGLGFQALFKSVEPTWVAKAIATLFILLGIYLIWNAERRATKVATRLDSHQVEFEPFTNFRVMAIVLTISAGLLIAALWWLM